MRSRRRSRHVLPGFRLTLGGTLIYLGLIVLLPLAALVLKTASGGWAHALASVSSPRVLASYRLSFGAALLAALVNGLFGLLTAWVLTRYDFFGRSLVDAIIDFPFALPTAVAGIALTALYAPSGWIGSALDHVGIKAAYSPLGVLLALIFIGFPFVVRTLQPVLRDLPTETEESAACLGANRWQTFRRVILPAISPAWIAGMLLAFGRAVGEYGSVVFISGNLPFRTEIAPLLIITKLEQYDYTGAAALGSVLLFAALVILVAVNLLQRWSNRRTGHLAA